MKFVLIHPPVAKPGEPPAGIARLAGALGQNKIACTVIDANISGLYYLLKNTAPPDDTWSQRAWRHIGDHLDALRNPSVCSRPDAYGRAVSDLNRILWAAGLATGSRPGLADFHHENLKPVSSKDLIWAARHPQTNPFYEFYRHRLLGQIISSNSDAAGISINYLSQALCGFALIGMIRKHLPDLKIILGGGLITSWMNQKNRGNLFSGLVDHLVAGAGENALLEMAGCTVNSKKYFPVPDYRCFADSRYLSPGFVLPFSASDGCWWQRCAFCPERAEKRQFRPLPCTVAATQLQDLARELKPSLIHLLDNALSPVLLKKLVKFPPGAPWYGFARMGVPLNDPQFCRDLAGAGCVMLKLGLESGSQAVLNDLNKGVDLETASRILENLYNAKISTYVYLLFGTPKEDLAAAKKTLDFTVAHKHAIDFLNLAVFNLPVNSPDAQHLVHRDFYAGNLALYCDFVHPLGWDRASVRGFLEKTFKKHPEIRPVIQNDPPVFTSNHAPFFTRTMQEKASANDHCLLHLNKAGHL
jgi:hypothetical protein